jgi:hypothetical protein
MSQEKLNAFLADLKRVNPRITLKWYGGKVTSIKGLIDYLQNTMNNPTKMTRAVALSHCAKPADPRLTKYHGAVDRLTSVWGWTDDEIAALGKFENIADTDGISWDDLNYEDKPFLFGARLGSGYVGKSGGFDITSRSLLLKAGLAPPVGGMADNCYIDRLELTMTELTAMQGKSILDVGCGAAMFRAEMEALYSCTTTGIDLHASITNAISQEVTNRYRKSMLYLKLKKELNTLSETTVPQWSGPLIDQLIQNLPHTINCFTNNPPRQDDVFQLSTTNQRYDFCVSMFLLGYFDAAEQTNAVTNMCAVTNTAIYLHSGVSPHLAPLIYDKAAIQTAYPNAIITVKNDHTHHIQMT